MAGPTAEELKALNLVYKQKDKIEAVFKEFDEDGLGTVSEEEFGMALELLGVDVSRPPLSTLTTLCTKDGMVNFVEFLGGVKPPEDKPPPPKPAPPKAAGPASADVAPASPGRPGPPAGKPGPPAGKPGPPAGKPGPPAGKPAPPAGKPAPPAGKPAPPAGKPGPPTGKPGPPAGKPGPPAEKPGPPAGKENAVPGAVPPGSPLAPKPSDMKVNATEKEKYEAEIEHLKAEVNRLGDYKSQMSSAQEELLQLLKDGGITMPDQLSVSIQQLKRQDKQGPPGGYQTDKKELEGIQVGSLKDRMANFTDQEGQNEEIDKKNEEIAKLKAMLANQGVGAMKFPGPRPEGAAPPPGGKAKGKDGGKGKDAGKGNDAGKGKDADKGKDTGKGKGKGKGKGGKGNAGPPPPPGKGKAGPPPPPGGKGKGVPPGPPGGVSKVDVPKPNVKMKALTWEKLPARLMAGSVWGNMNGGDEIVSLMDTAKLEELFGAQVMAKPIDGTKDKGPEKKKGPQYVNILDPKRGQAVAIMLAQFRISFKDIREAVLELDEDMLDAETVEKMIPAAPTAEEMTEIKAYAGALSKLGKPEQYFKEIGQIPRLPQRLATFHFKLTFDEKFKELQGGIDTLLASAVQVMESKLFTKLLEVVLTFGNFLNHGSFRGNAQGVKIKFLAEIKATKANPKYTMMHYLNEYLVEHKDKLHVDGVPLDKFADDIDRVEAATRIDSDQTEADLNALAFQLNEVTAEVKQFKTMEAENPTKPEDVDAEEAQDMYGEKMEQFVKEAESQVTELTGRMKEAKTKLNALVVHFAEDPNKMKSKDILTIVKEFRTDFVRAADELAKEKAKADHRAKQQERASARRAGAAGGDMASEAAARAGRSKSGRSKPKRNQHSV